MDIGHYAASSKLGLGLPAILLGGFNGTRHNNFVVGGSGGDSGVLDRRPSSLESPYNIFTELREAIDVHPALYQNTTHHTMRVKPGIRYLTGPVVSPRLSTASAPGQKANGQKATRTYLFSMSTYTSLV